jgi:predicted aldo/keto reductase-like oxidoreductase
MKFKTLGKTGLTVSTVGYGGLGRPGLSPETIQLAFEGGINFIDTAHTYGESEAIIGKALKNMGNRDKIILSSKCIRRELSDYRAAFENSLALLGTDYLDIMLVHDVSTKESWRLVRENGIVDFLKERKAKGSIRHIGCSTHDEGIGREMIESGLFEVVMLAYNAANPELEDSLIPLAKAADMGIIVMKPFGGGILTDTRSRELGFELSAEDALRFALSNPQVDTVIPGMVSAEHVNTALKVWNEDRALSAEERRAILDKVTIRGRNYCRGCGYCQPCPVGIEIPAVLSLYNRWEVFGRTDWSQKHQIRTEFVEKIPTEQGPEACVKCGACTTRCPYNLPIPDLMESCRAMR